MQSGVATRPLADLKAYRASLERYVYTSGTVMQPVFQAASDQPTKRIVYAEGEDDRVLRAAQVAVDEKLARPVLVGRPEVIEARSRDLGLRLEAGRDYEVVGFDDRRAHRAGGRGLLPARPAPRPDPRLCGRRDAPQRHPDRRHAGARGPAPTACCAARPAPMPRTCSYVAEAIGVREGVRELAAMHLLMLPQQTVFICDTYINPDPTADAARRHRPARGRGGAPLRPRAAAGLPVALQLRLGRHAHARARCARRCALVQERAPELEAEGEMHADAALSKRMLDQVFPDSRLTAEANLLIMPNLDAANITFNALKIVAGQGVTVGPILLGAAKPVHILTPTSTVRRLVNMTALTAVDAASLRQA